MLGEQGKRQKNTQQGWKEKLQGLLRYLLWRDLFQASKIFIACINWCQKGLVRIRPSKRLVSLKGDRLETALETTLWTNQRGNYQICKTFTAEKDQRNFHNASIPQERVNGHPNRHGSKNNYSIFESGPFYSVNKHSFRWLASEYPAPNQYICTVIN